jgi:hypothetical protein
MKLIEHPSKVTFSRGPKGKTEYSPGGQEGETVEVPQIDEELSSADFMQALINLVGNEDETKKIVNRRVLAEPAIRDGQQEFKRSWKKGKVVNIEEAIKTAILAVRDYVPVLAKERGVFIQEATAAKNTMDSLKAAKAKVVSGELSMEQFHAMLEAAFDEEKAA